MRYYLPVLIVIPLLAFVTCVLLHIAALSLFPRWDLLDFPERYRLHRPRIPYPTGIIAVVVFLIFFIFAIPLTNDQFSMINIQNSGIILSIVLLGVTSFLDDRTPLPPRLRLMIQIIVAAVIFATGSRIYTITNPLEYMTGIPYLKLDSINIPLYPTPLPLLSGLFTILWLGLAMNALNWFDGIPGQVSSLSTLGFTIIGLLALSARVQQPNVALISFTLAGICAACLLFDFPFTLSLSKGPLALMGDTGAMFFGLMLGILTIYAGGKVATAFLAFGVPFTDCLIVIIRRIISGHSPFRGSTAGEHLHHRLLTARWSSQKIIFLNLLLGSTFGITALFLSTLGKFLTGILLFSIMLGLSWYTRPVTNHSTR